MNSDSDKSDEGSRPGSDKEKIASGDSQMTSDPQKLPSMASQGITGRAESQRRSQEGERIFRRRPDQLRLDSHSGRQLTNQQQFLSPATPLVRRPVFIDRPSHTSALFQSPASGSYQGQPSATPGLPRSNDPALESAVIQVPSLVCSRSLQACSHIPFSNLDSSTPNQAQDATLQALGQSPQVARHEVRLQPRREPRTAIAANEVSSSGQNLLQNSTNPSRPKSLKVTIDLLAPRGQQVLVEGHGQQSQQEETERRVELHENNGPEDYFNLHEHILELDEQERAEEEEKKESSPSQQATEQTRQLSSFTLNRGQQARHQFATAWDQNEFTFQNSPREGQEQEPFMSMAAPVSPRPIEPMQLEEQSQQNTFERKTRPRSGTMLRTSPDQNDERPIQNRKSSSFEGDSVKMKRTTTKKESRISPTPVQPEQMPCKCTEKTRCITLHCWCFSSLFHCTRECGCKACKNILENEKELKEARALIHKRNNNAFDAQLKLQATEREEKEEERNNPSQFLDRRVRQPNLITKCNCMKTRCLNDHCSCFSANSFCGAECKCPTKEDTDKKKQCYNREAPREIKEEVLKNCK